MTEPTEEEVCGGEQNGIQPDLPEVTYVVIDALAGAVVGHPNVSSPVVHQEGGAYVRSKSGRWAQWCLGLQMARHRGETGPAT